MPRKLRLGLRDVLAVLLTAVVIALLFGSGVLNRRKTWENVLSRMKFAEGVCTKAEDGARIWSLADGQAYGTYGSGPEYNLDRGTYRLSWNIEGDGVNRIHLSARNNAKITPDVIETDPVSPEGSCAFQIEEAVAYLQISFEFASGKTMTVRRIGFTSPAYTDNAWTAALLLVGMLVFFLLWEHGVIGKEGMQDLVLLGAAILLMSVPCLKDTTPNCHDSWYHCARLLNLKEGLLAGDFPVRMGRFSYNGYGAVTSMFYPDLYLYPFAFMMACGASLIYAVNAMNIALNIVSGLTMYFCAAHIFHDRKTSLAASLLYICATYRLCNIYIRNALGEASAMAVMPVFLCGLWEVFFGDRDEWPLLGVGAALIFQCHLLSTMMSGCFAAIMGILFLPRLIREKRILPIVKAVVLALLLCCSFLVPFLHYYRQGVQATELNGTCENSALAPAQLFLWAGGDTAVSSADGRLSDYPMTLALPILFGIFLLLRHAFLSGTRDRDTRGALLLTAGGAVACWMVTTLFPWEKAGILTHGLSQYVQYPFRLLAFATLLMSPAAAYGYMHAEKTDARRMLLLVTIFAMLWPMNLITDTTRTNRYYRFAEITPSSLYYVEYLLPGTNPRKNTVRVPEVQGDVQLSDYEKDGTDIRCGVTSEQGGSVILPLFNFDGYSVTLDGEPLSISTGSINRMTVQVPAGACGTLEVHYVGQGIWHVFDALSAVTAAAAACLLVRRAKRRKPIFGKKEEEEEGCRA